MVCLSYIKCVDGSDSIIDPEDPTLPLYDVDDASTIIELDEWYHDFAPALQAAYFSPDNGGGSEPVPDSGLINGAGRFNGGPEVPWAVINVQHGRRYRMRLINSSAFAQYLFGIQDHPMTIIEADGILHDPHTVDSLNIYVAQRYDVFLLYGSTKALIIL